jgi:hypothetical protein
MRARWRVSGGSHLAANAIGRQAHDRHRALPRSIRLLMINEYGRQPLSEYQRWELRYAEKEYVFGKAPNYFLASCKSLLPRYGKVLAVADGEARNGVWLAEQGLDVLSIDFSPSAQVKGRLLATERGVTVAPKAGATLEFGELMSTLGRTRRAPTMLWWRFLPSSVHQPSAPRSGQACGAR